MQILRSPFVLFFAMAAAVVLIAGGTFAIGRWWLKRHRPPPIAMHRPKIESSERTFRSESPGREHTTPRVIVRQEGSGDVNLTPATAALFSNVKLVPTGGSEELRGWSQPGDEAAWEIHIIKPGFFELTLNYQAAEVAGEFQLAVRLDDEELKGFDLHPTLQREGWTTQQQTIIISTAGKHEELAVQLRTQIDAGALVVKGCQLKAVGSAAAKSRQVGADEAK